MIGKKNAKLWDYYGIIKLTNPSTAEMQVENVVAINESKPRKRKEKWKKQQSTKQLRWFGRK